LTQDEDRFYTIKTVKHTWTMKDIPSFGYERYLTTPENYVDKIEFQLSGTNDGETTQYENNSWAKATEELLQRGDFGGALTAENQQLNDAVDKLGGTDPLAQAKAIYYYINHHFTCTNYYDKYVKTDLRDVLKSNSGTVGDLNLMLVAMLRRKGLVADPIVLSTREYGFNLASYPMLGRLNYVIARVKVDGVVYYLDAAHPELGFGQLAANCYNGHARIISNKDSGSVWFQADSLKESTTTMVMLSASDKGMEGVWQATLGK
jgi:transglutaminase-like putative cysteine protease